MNQKKQKEYSIILNNKTVSRLELFGEYLSKQTKIQHNLEDIVNLFLLYLIDKNHHISIYLKDYFSKPEINNIIFEILLASTDLEENAKLR